MKQPNYANHEKEDLKINISSKRKKTSKMKTMGKIRTSSKVNRISTRTPDIPKRGILHETWKKLKYFIELERSWKNLMKTRIWEKLKEMKKISKEQELTKQNKKTCANHQKLEKTRLRLIESQPKKVVVVFVLLLLLLMMTMLLFLLLFSPRNLPLKFGQNRFSNL